MENFCLDTLNLTKSYAAGNTIEMRRAKMHINKPRRWMKASVSSFQAPEFLEHQLLAVC